MKQPFERELARCEDLLAQGYQLWESLAFPPLTHEEKNQLPLLALEGTHHPHAHYFAAACQSFFLFRTLHGLAKDGQPTAILLGDYFFGIFSQCLIPLDSTWLTLEFSKFLRGDSEGGVDGTQSFDKVAYLSFVKGLACQLSP